jgi:hypothetical protein
MSIGFMFSNETLIRERCFSVTLEGNLEIILDSGKIAQILIKNYCFMQ